MNAVVFLGPTLSAEEGSSLLPGAVFRGPVACGDVYLAVREGFRFIAIVDGYFEHQPSVWHKELLWALASGVRVYGAASMGALRAAELEPFGMIGVGHVFEQYRDGVYTDDDEVAVIHEASERGFRPVSEAMVNIRCTLARAAAAGVLGEWESAQLLALAKGLFYGERSYGALRQRAIARGLDAESLAALWAWLDEHGGVSQKREDACALLGRIADDQRAKVGVAAPTFEFEYTDAWHAFKQQMDARFAGTAEASVAGVAPTATGSATTAPSAGSEALLRALALQLAQADGVAPSAEQVQAHSELLRRRLGLLSPGTTGAWLAKHQLDLCAFSRLVYEDWLTEQYREQAIALGAAQRPAVAALR